MVIKILLLENVHPDAFEKLSSDGFTVELVKTSIPEDELIEKLQGVHVLGIRSKTQVTKKVIEAADKLMVVGAFCIGTKQIDLETVPLYTDQEAWGGELNYGDDGMPEPTGMHDVEWQLLIPNSAMMDSASSSPRSCLNCTVISSGTK